MTDFLNQILEKLGWQDGFQIPIANSENKLLEAELAQLQLTKVKRKHEIENITQKLDNFNNHLKHLEQESEQNQKLITAESQQFQSEEDSYHVQQSEKSKIIQDTQNILKKTKEINERKAFFNLHLQKSAQKLEKLKVESNWDLEALNAWEETLQQKDLDNSILKKFSKEDEHKYNELEKKRQQLENEVIIRKKTVDTMVAELNKYEYMLNRTAKVMQQQIIERDALIVQWKTSVDILRQRDKDINKHQNQIYETQELIDKQLELLKEQNTFLENEEKNNEEIHKIIANMNGVNSRIRRDLNELNNYILLLNNEFVALKKTLISDSNHLEKSRSKSKFLRNDIDNKEEKIENYKNNLLKLKNKLEETNRLQSDSLEKAKYLEAMINFEQKRHKILFGEIDGMQTVLLKSQNGLLKEQDYGKSQDSKINNLQSSMLQLKRYNKERKSNADRQHEIIYDLEYKIDDLKRKILHEQFPLLGKDLGDESYELKLRDLEKELNELTDIRNLLQDQVNKMLEDMKRLQLIIGTDQTVMSNLKDKLQNQVLSFDIGQKQLVQAQNLTQEKQVEENILRLRLNQLEKATKKQENKIFSLQKYRLSLELAMKERLYQINADKEILLVTKRNLMCDKGRLKGDINIREIRSQQFKKKYELTIACLGKDECGETVSITEFKIKAAQEKFMMKLEGDEIDCKIRKAEKEIIAMENTLMLLNATNTKFKESLSAVDEKGLENNEKKLLEEESLRISDEYRKYRKELSLRKEELKEIKSKYEFTLNMQEEQNVTIKTVEKDYIETQREIDAKEEKLSKREHYLKTLRKQIKEEELEKFDRDLEIRQLKDTNKNIKKRLAELSSTHPDITPLINRYVNEYKIQLPDLQKLQPLVSKRSSSSRSSIKSASSTSSSCLSTISKVTLSFNL